MKCVLDKGFLTKCDDCKDLVSSESRRCPVNDSYKTICDEKKHIFLMNIDPKCKFCKSNHHCFMLIGDYMRAMKDCRSPLIKIKDSIWVKAEDIFPCEDKDDDYKQMIVGMTFCFYDHKIIVKGWKSLMENEE